MFEITPPSLLLSVSEAGWQDCTKDLRLKYFMRAGWRKSTCTSAWFNNTTVQENRSLQNEQSYKTNQQKPKPKLTNWEAQINSLLQSVLQHSYEDTLSSIFIQGTDVCPSVILMQWKRSISVMLGWTTVPGAQISPCCTFATTSSYVEESTTLFTKINSQ